MKNKLLGLAALFSFIMSYGQTTRFVYDTYVNPDSINLVTLKNEITFLDVKNDKSLFISERKLKRDSLQQIGKKEDKKVSKKEPKNNAESTFFEYFIIKDFDNKKTFYHEKIADRELYYQEDRPLLWKIEEEKSKIANYEAQKATANFGGRVWTAWFTKEIPISDGPYKLSGLPGLIVKLEDDKGDYKFELLRKVMVNNAYEEKLHPNAKKTSRADFKADKVLTIIELSKDKKLDFLHHRSMQNGRMDSRNGNMGMNGMPPMNNSMNMGSRNMDGPSNINFENSVFGNGIQNPIELN